MLRLADWLADRCHCTVAEPLRLMLPPEARREQVGKGGIVRDPQVHREVLLGVIAAAPGMGFVPLGLAVSPIRGAEGNVEFLLHLRAGAAEPFDAEGAVETALQAVDSV